MRVFARLLALVGCLYAGSVSAQTIGTVNFDFDSATLDATAQAQVAQIAEQMKANPSYKPTIVVGHTDAVGSSNYNQSLGQRRAEAVAAALEAQGVPVSRIGTIESRGKSELLVAVSAPERRNRRVQVTLDDMLAACRSYRNIGLTQASVGDSLQTDLVAKLNTSVNAYRSFSQNGQNGPAFQMAGAARETCGMASSLDMNSDRKVEFSQKCLCDSARLQVALGN